MKRKAKFLLLGAALLAASPASAQNGDPQPGLLFNLVILGGFFLLFYFLFIRPQSRRAKAHRELLENLKKGDEVSTSGGVMGVVTQVDQQYIELEVAKGMRIKFLKHSINSALPKGTLGN